MVLFECVNPFIKCAQSELRGDKYPEAYTVSGETLSDVIKISLLFSEFLSMLLKLCHLGGGAGIQLDASSHSASLSLCLCGLINLIKVDSERKFLG